MLLRLPQRHLSGAPGTKLLEHEFGLLRELSLAGVPRVVELIRDDSLCCLVLEDRGGLPLRTLCSGRPLSLERFFRLGLRLATLLAELHRQDVIHQSLSPDNILISEESAEITLTGFGFASRSAAETQATLRPGRSALVYLSPEQTGRMNRSVDYRTDFYSLGVTFYELLTGRPPFRSDDALELIHSHIARVPPAPAEINPEIPKPLSLVVMKLLEKTAEQRYQSALGLKEDLSHCAREWTARGRIESFAPGGRAVPDRFLISQKLYGREREVGQLLRAFDRVCEGRAAAGSMMLVAGYSGIGKTALIQELYKPIVRERGYFISGKFDQVVRGVPFGALIQAFRGLVRQLLTESEEQLAAWRERLSKALGAQGGVLTEVIPEIELIIGVQPPAPALGPTEALNRFQMVFQNFVGALARPEHPLVVFLDDLQWADAATLGLLGPLLTSREIEALFLMGAYRDNEVDAGHSLTRTLGTLESAGVELRRITLGPLELADLTLLVRDTLHGDLADAEPLARLVMEKTGGNPFFVIQFLKTLHREGFITFDYEQCRWTYRLEAIASAPLTDNVIDLMTQQIAQLSGRAQRALTLAACIGNSFDQNTLAIVSEQSEEATAEALREAINEGLILPAEELEMRNAEHGRQKVSNASADRIPHSALRTSHSARTKLDKARVCRLRMAQFENQSRYSEALVSAREGLALFDVSFPDAAEAKQAALESEIENIHSLLGARSIASLTALPAMTDPETQMVMSILTEMWASTYILGDVVMARLISATLVRLSLLHGNAAESGYGYVTHAITVGPVRGDYKAAYEFGRLALQVNERFNDSRRRARIYQQFHAHVALWREPMQNCVAYAQEACRSGLEAGDFLYAAYGAATETWPAFFSTQNLAQFLRDYTPALALIRKLKNTGFADAHQLILSQARALRGETSARLSLSAEGFDESEYVRNYAGNPFFTMFHLTARLQLAYLFEEFDQALEAAQQARRIAHHLSGTIWPVLLDYWGGLALAACYSSAAESEQSIYLQEIKDSQSRLARLAENCPENYLCPALLLAAEIERIAGREMAALDLYEQAVRYAAQTNMIQYQALAGELYARFWRDREQTKAAAVFLAEARNCYAQWGATAKVVELERRYADLLALQAGDKLDFIHLHGSAQIATDNTGFIRVPNS